MHELIVHVGPAKTGSTTIQEMLKQSQGLLQEHDIDLALPAAHSAHHALANHLAPLVGDSWFELDSTRDLFPPIAPARGRHLLTAEGLARIGTEGVTRLLDWASPDRVTVIAYVREPVGWLWSWWQQTCKSLLWTEWDDNVRDAADRREFILSTVLDPWIRAAPGLEVHIVPLELSEHPFTSFCEAIGLPGGDDIVHREDFKHLNASMGVLETLLTAALVREVVTDLRSRSWQYYGDLDEAFVSRACLDLVDRARPMAEVARVMESSWGADAGTLLDGESRPLVDHYRHAWIDDARQVAQTCAELTPESRQRLETALDRYESSDSAAGFTRPYGEGFPRRGFTSHLALPAEFFTSARLMAASAGLTSRAVHGPPDDPAKAHEEGTL